MKMLLMFLAITLLFTGCLATAPIQKLNPATYYVNDVCFTYYKSRRDTVKFCGVGVLPYAKEYKLRIQNEGKLNFFSMTSCHREKTTENYDKGIFKKDGVITVDYEPTSLEEGRACPLFVAAFSRKGKHGWGAVYFEHKKYQLKATVLCNGKEYYGYGVSVCQAREGLTQKITFEKEVVSVKPINGAAERKQDCPVLATKDKKTFIFAMPSRECTYGFVEKESKKVHMFNTIGYEQLIIRE